MRKASRNSLTSQHSDRTAQQHVHRCDEVRADLAQVLLRLLLEERVELPVLPQALEGRDTLVVLLEVVDVEQEELAKLLEELQYSTNTSHERCSCDETKKEVPHESQGKRHVPSIPVSFFEESSAVTAHCSGKTSCMFT